MTTMTRKPRTVKAKAAPVVSLALAIDHVVYTVEPVPAGEFGTRAFRLVKRSADGAVYDVVRTHAGLVECDCPSYEVTFRGTCSTCKHGSALVAMGLLDAPAFVAPADSPSPAVVEPAPAVESPAPCCPPVEAEPCTECVPPSDDEPIGWAKRPRPTAPAVPPSPKPVKLAPLPDGRYDLAGLIDGQAAFLRGQDNAAFTLMAKALADLAASVRASGAKSVANFEDRIIIMDGDRADRFREQGFEAGYQSALQDFGTA